MNEVEERHRSRRGKNIGWTLLAALVVAVSVAISLAVQLDHSRTTPPPDPDPECGLFYNDCCQNLDRAWRRCVVPCDDSDDRRGLYVRDTGEGLFDAEGHFSDDHLPPRC